MSSWLEDPKDKNVYLLDVSRLSPNFPPGLPSGSPPRNLLSTADAVDVVHGRGSRGGEIARRQIQLGIFVRRFSNQAAARGTRHSRRWRHVRQLTGEFSYPSTREFPWTTITRERAPGHTRQGRDFRARGSVFLGRGKRERRRIIRKWQVKKKEKMLGQMTDERGARRKGNLDKGWSGSRLTRLTFVDPRSSYRSILEAKPCSEW